MSNEEDGGRCRAPSTLLHMSGLDCGTLDDALCQSYEISDMGTFQMGDDCRINQKGILMKMATTIPEGLNVDGTNLASRRGSVCSFVLSADSLVEIGQLGQGAGGVVLKCVHAQTGTLIAVKKIDVLDKDKRAQFRKELETFAGVKPCPQLVQFVGAYYNEGSTYLALKYCNRGCLGGVVKKYGALPESVIASIAKQCCQGLEHLHTRGRLHRDLKPGNILIEADGRVCVSDFGILRRLADTELSMTFKGTAKYMSPERITTQGYSFPSDIWSLGLSLLTCAYGKYPLDTSGGVFGLRQKLCEDPIPKVPDTFSKACRSFIEHCLFRDPHERGTATDLLTHPFIAKVDAMKVTDWPYPALGGEIELADLDLITEAVVKKLYPNGKDDYKKSLFEKAKLSRIIGSVSQQLSIDHKIVKQKLESLLQ